jgi:acetyltransferase-like isoleucine patch superfamily enzyme
MPTAADTDPRWTFHRRGTNIRVYDRAVILSAEHITLGSNIIIDDFVFVGAHRKLILGNHVHLASHASITGGGEVLICDFCGVSSGARILSGTDDFTEGALTGPTIPPEFRKVTRGRVVLEPHVVIGSNAVVLPGITIGEGATVGAGSVVTTSLEPWGVYVGAPAHKIDVRPRDVLKAAERRLFETYGLPAIQYTSAACLQS